MVTIWGFNFVVIRWGLNDVPPMTLTVLRFALAAFPAVLFVRRPQPSWRLVTGYGLFAFTVQFGLLFAGMQAGMPTGLASLVIQVQAFFTIGLVALLTHERAKPIQLVGATIAGAGLVLVAFHLPASTRIGFLLVVAAAVSWAIANVIVKRIHSEQPLAVVVWASAAASIMMLPVALVLEGPATMWSHRQRDGHAGVVRPGVSGVAHDAARLRHLGVAAAPAPRSADCTVYSAGTDRCNELRCLAAG